MEFVCPKRFFVSKSFQNTTGAVFGLLVLLCGAIICVQQREWRRNLQIMTRYERIRYDDKAAKQRRLKAAHSNAEDKHAYDVIPMSLDTRPERH
jgi:hypothetical protein